MRQMWLGAANVGFTAAGAALYVVARRQLLMRPAGARRRVELGACALVGLLAVAALALAHLGMNESWTGRAAVTDLAWLGHGLALAGALLAAHALLRLQHSRADELVLPLAALLVVLGLVTVDTWETRDANAYLSTVALPALRALPGGKAETPNELRYEDRRSGHFATVLDRGWLERANAAIRRHPELELHEVRIHDALRRQLGAAVLAFLSFPLVLFLAARMRAAPAAVARALPAAAALVAAVVAAALVSSGDHALPALVRVGGGVITVYEPLKLLLVVVLALALAGVAPRRTTCAALAVAALAVAALTWQDTGAGVALASVAALMLALVVGRRWRLAVAGLAALAISSGPASVRALEAHLPETVGVRMEMWADPWGAFHRAALDNEAARTLDHLVAYRAEPPGERSLAAAAASSAPALHRDVGRIEQELRWRLGSVPLPLVPGDEVDELLLLEAEGFWADLGGFHSARGDGLGAFRGRVDDAIGRLRAGADRREAELLASGRLPKGEAPVPDNFQLQRGLYALREGGLVGVGLGRGRPEAVPGLTEDIALVSVGESLGLAGVGLVALSLLLLVGRGAEASLEARSRLRALLLVGLSALLGLQTVIAIGGVSGVLPFTGLTFPLVGRSGTALVANVVALALVAALAAEPARPRRGLLRAGGFPAAVGLVLAGIAVLQLTGRTIAPGPLLAPLPGKDAPFLHARDQWETPFYRRVPGPILDRGGRPLADTGSLGAARSYPRPALATTLGHTLQQLDVSFRRELTGGSSLVGPALATTIDAGVQQALHDGIDQGSLEAGVADLAALRGAGIVLDVSDGAIVALESRPSFSLAELADPVAWARAEARERRAGFPYRYLNRAVNGYYPPGSIFKTVTAAGALERGLHTLHSRDFDYTRGSKSRRAPDGLDQLGIWHRLSLPDGAPITDGNHPHVDDWVFDLQDAFAWSCNVAFAELGLELGATDLVATARRFGFERPLRVAGLGVSTSTLDNDASEDVASRYLARSASNLARTAFGQGQARVTPLQMALVAAAIANGGRIMQPHVVAGWRGPDGAWLARTRPRVFANTRLSSVAMAELRELMWASATYGWAKTARLNPSNANPCVAGKTGSAEWSETLDASHAWFIGYFPAERPRLAVALVVERGGAGPTIAARIAHRVFAADALQAYVAGRERP